MILLLVVGVALIGVAAWFATRAVVSPRLQASERLSQIGAYGYPEAEAGAEAAGETLGGRVERLADRLGASVLPRWGGEERELRWMLVAAGIYGIAPETFLGYRALGAIVLPLAWLWSMSMLGASTALVLLGALLVGLLGWRLPLVAVERRAKRRQEEIGYQLPELIDGLVVTVEAGSGFHAALQLASDELAGALGEEISLALREQAMGLSNEAALENLARRVDTPEVHGFVRAVLQGGKLGVSIGDIMRSLAGEARARRRAAAEERAHKAPVKMLFPLVLLMFPAMMIILLYPAIHNILQALNGS